MNKDYLVEVDLDLPLTQVANSYYLESKKLKSKLDGLQKAQKEIQKRLDSAKSIKVIESEVKIKRERLWFEKFRWSFTRSGHLVIAGRDTYTNEMVVKKYMEDNDLHFHTNIHGSAHTILKNGQKSDLQDQLDAGLIAAIYSRAWNEGFGSVDVYYVNPNQVTKTANSGESLGTGAFVIRGERNWLKKIPLQFTVGVINLKEYGYNGDYLMVGSKDIFLINNSPFFVELTTGSKQKSDVCNQILKELKIRGFKQFDVNDLLSILPAGPFSLSEKKK